MAVLGTNLTSKDATKIVVAKIMEEDGIFEIIYVLGDNEDISPILSGLTPVKMVVEQFSKIGVDYMLRNEKLPIYTCEISHNNKIMTKDEVYKSIFNATELWKMTYKFKEMPVEGNSVISSIRSKSITEEATGINYERMTKLTVILTNIVCDLYAGGEIEGFVEEELKELEEELELDFNLFQLIQELELLQDKIENNPITEETVGISYERMAKGSWLLMGMIINYFCIACEIEYIIPELIQELELTQKEIEFLEI